VVRWVGVNLQDLFLTSQDGFVLDTKSVVIEGVEDRTGRAVSKQPATRALDEDFS
jgi:hypothetical protein